MKAFLLCCTLFTATSLSRAQNDALSPDQNPNYKKSQDKYTASAKGLQVTLNTTVQQTYKAFDWYEAKQERKEVRRNDRRERNLYRLQNQGNYFNPYYSFYDPYNDPYRYAPYRNRYHGLRRW